MTDRLPGILKRLKTREQCEQAELQVLKLIGEIESKLRQWHIQRKRGQANYSYGDQLQQQLKENKRIKSGIQNHRGTLPKKARGGPLSIESRFLDAARELLPRDLFQSVMDRVHDQIRMESISDPDAF